MVDGNGYAILAISDICLVSTIFKGVAKGGFTALFKNHKNWSSWRRFYGKEGFADKGQHLHHWAIPRNEQKSGEGFMWWLKNQQMFLKPVPKIKGMSYDAVHKAIEGKGIYNWSIGKRFYYGTPSWVKSMPVSTGGRIIDVISDE